ncbi:MAG TPA: DNA-directed RNA polymerase subunit omega [Candidatus Aminicenantes bacterium]|nr:DNA-directed RNA polymerase subunit omega [Candidatus Aminicenantes bacterium]
MNIHGNIDSKFRFVILASKRAKELLKGAKPKIKSKSKNPIRIAQSEVGQGVIEFEILPTVKDEAPEREERVFMGEELAEEAGEAEDVGGEKAPVDEEEAEEEFPADSEEEDDGVLGKDLDDGIDEDKDE